MADLIDRQKIINHFEVLDDTGGINWCRPVVLSMINNFPAADVAPVVHGRWNYNNSINFWQCSCCGVNAPLQGEFMQLKTRYCPNCGARMDGE